ncbi:hypothetical protein [Bacillus sp. MUM 13]|uniref:hypothetical protein n=1 Tax=Bacillus sp. MUM 13 TaxID=1678001 RepID=UPI0008F59403|nr:hypothetical protein [Bacillus sp. MUM 13]OIK12634.1 hypothetical protein BIV59_08060 [Bacillus sp. MUM 13]
MNKIVLLVIYWFILIFSFSAKVSDRLILWVNPDIVSTSDERIFYTFIPVSLNFIVLFSLRKKAIKTLSIRIMFTINALFFLYYFYCQFIWDAGEWQLFQDSLV